MTVEEAKRSVAELKSQGASDEQALATFYTMFKNGKLDYEQFEIFADLVGYALSDEFKNLSDDEKKNVDFMGYGNEDNEDNEEEFDENEDKEDKEEDFDFLKYYKAPEDKDDEEDKAMRLFGDNK